MFCENPQEKLEKWHTSEAIARAKADAALPALSAPLLLGAKRRPRARAGGAAGAGAGASAGGGHNQSHHHNHHHSAEPPSPSRRGRQRAESQAQRPPPGRIQLGAANGAGPHAAVELAAADNGAPTPVFLAVPTASVVQLPVKVRFCAMQHLPFAVLSTTYALLSLCPPPVDLVCAPAILLQQTLLLRTAKSGGPNAWQPRTLQLTWRLGLVFLNATNRVRARLRCPNAFPGCGTNSSGSGFGQLINHALSSNS